MPFLAIVVPVVHEERAVIGAVAPDVAVMVVDGAHGFCPAHPGVLRRSGKERHVAVAVDEVAGPAPDPIGVETGVRGSGGARGGRELTVKRANSTVASVFRDLLQIRLNGNEIFEGDLLSVNLCIRHGVFEEHGSVGICDRDHVPRLQRIRGDLEDTLLSVSPEAPLSVTMSVGIFA